jgi:inward rectifier potassium channel
MTDQKPAEERRAAAAPRHMIGVGSFEIYKTGASRYDLRDPYHLVATMSWPMFFASFVLSELSINLVFALLYAAQPGAIANARPGSLADAFFFSIETLATVGYGAMVPVTRYGHVISALEIVCGVVYTAIVTGVIFIRFSKPKAKILYADHPVVTHHNGHPTLMLRIANGRTHMLADARARLHVLMDERSPEGHRFRRLHTLPLAREDFPLFALTWTLMHRIDATSPLCGLGPEGLAGSDVRMFVSVEARDPALAAQVHDLKTYPGASVLFGMRYADAVGPDEQGRTVADVRKISLMEPDPAAV